MLLEPVDETYIATNQRGLRAQTASDFGFRSCPPWGLLIRYEILQTSGSKTI